MATLYHGTTLENWERIQVEGWNGPSRQVAWECSYNEVYCYDLSKAECDDYQEEECISRAFESAQTAAAVQNYKGETLVVIKLEVPDDMVEDDWSCEGVSDVASVVQPEDIRQEHIAAVYRCENYCPSLRMLYVAGLLTYNDYLVRSRFSELELKMSEKLTEVFIDEILEFDWYETTPQ